MSNLFKNSLNNSTPIKRVGLSRKRKSLGVCGGGSPTQSPEAGCPKRMALKKDENTCRSQSPKEPENISKETATDSTKGENHKCSKDKITELECLYSTWKIGCKAAFLYLLDKLKETEGDKVNVKQLLRQLGVLKVMSNHFANDFDLDFDFSTSDSD